LTTAELEEAHGSQMMEKRRIVERLGSLLDQANELLSCFKQPFLSNGDQMLSSIALPPSTVLHVTAMERYW
jgi:hypothetical protein